jgi:OTU domain-containing protein 6
MYNLNYGVQSMEALQRSHQLEQKDLESRIRQKKRSATKKTRKGVSNECTSLERQLLEKQSIELLGLQDESALHVQSEEPNLDELTEVASKKPTNEDEELRSPVISTTSKAMANDQAKKPSRQKARLARRAAEQEAAVTQAAKEAQDLPNLRDQEREAMRKEFRFRNLTEKEIRSDGHCLYAAVADQIKWHEINLKSPIKTIDMSRDCEGQLADYKITRKVAAAFINNNPDDFLPFLEQPIEDYTRSIRETGEWGGHVELMALAKAYGVVINVLQCNGKVEKIEGSTESSKNQLWLAYYRHNFGLGEHYNSLHPVIQ